MGNSQNTAIDISRVRVDDENIQLHDEHEFNITVVDKKNVEIPQKLQSTRENSVIRNIKLPIRDADVNKPAYKPIPLKCTKKENDNNSTQELLTTKHTQPQRFHETMEVLYPNMFHLVKEFTDISILRDAFSKAYPTEPKLRKGYYKNKQQFTDDVLNNCLFLPAIIPYSRFLLDDFFKFFEKDVQMQLVKNLYLESVSQTLGAVNSIDTFSACWFLAEGFRDAGWRILQAEEELPESKQKLDKLEARKQILEKRYNDTRELLKLRLRAYDHWLAKCNEHYVLRTVYDEFSVAELFYVFNICYAYAYECYLHETLLDLSHALCDKVEAQELYTKYPESCNINGHVYSTSRLDALLDEMVLNSGRSSATIPTYFKTTQNVLLINEKDKDSEKIVDMCLLSIRKHLSVIVEKTTKILTEGDVHCISNARLTHKTEFRDQSLQVFKDNTNNYNQERLQIIQSIDYTLKKVLCIKYLL